MKTKTLLAAVAAAMGLAASAEIGNIVFPASLGSVANDLNGQALGTVEVVGGTMAITGAANSSMQSLTLTGDATVVSVLDTIKPAGDNVRALAGVDDAVKTTYYNTWAGAVAAYDVTDASKSLEMRSSPEATPFTLAAINDKVVVDTTYGVFKDANITTTPTDSKYIEFAKSGNATTYIAKWDLSKATVADIASHKYDATDYTPALTVTHAGGGTLELTTDYTVAWDANRHVGTGTVTLTGVSGSDYDGTTSAEFNITKRAVTMTSGTDTKVYDNVALVKEEVTETGDGFVTGEGATYAYTGSQLKAGTSKNAFSYTLNSGTLAGDYEITQVQGDLTVTARPVTITADAGQRKTFGAAEPTLTATVAGNVPSDGYEFAYTVTRDAGEQKGSYPITVAGAASQFDGCYAVTYEGGTFTIGAKSLTPAMIAAIADQIYTGHDIEPAITVTDTDENGSIAASDYTIGYDQNRLVSVVQPEEGEEYLASVTITATEDGNYEGSATKTFVIDGTVAGEKVIALANDNALVYVPQGATVEVAHDQTAAVTGTGVIAKAGSVRAEVTGALASDATVSEGTATYLYGNQPDVTAIAAVGEGLVRDASGVLAIRAQEDVAGRWAVTE